MNLEEREPPAGACAESKGGTSRTASVVAWANSGGGDAPGWAGLGGSGRNRAFYDPRLPIRRGKVEPIRARPVPNPRECLVAACQR